MTAAPSALTDHLGYWLRKVSNAVSGRFAGALGARGFTVPEWVMLRELLEAERSPAQLATRMGMTKGGITKLADRLAGRGLIVRRSSATDGRSVTLSLTEAGREVVPDLAALADANDAAFFDPLTDDERRRLRALLVGLADRHRLGPSPVD